MPKAMEQGLKRSARKKYGSTTSKKARAYIYGGMKNRGWTPNGKKG